MRDRQPPIMVAHPPETRHQFSPEEYLEREINSDIRHAYIDGEIVPMTGAMPNHNRITRNLCTAITLGLKGQPYKDALSFRKTTDRLNTKQPDGS